MNNLPLLLTIGIGIVGALACFAVYLVAFQAACTVLNNARRRPRASSSVPEPPLGRVCGITAIVLTVDVLVGVAVAVIVSMAGPKDAPALALSIRTLCDVPLWLFVGAVVFSEMLPTRYANAVLLRLIQLFILAIVFGTIGLVAAIFVE